MTGEGVVYPKSSLEWIKRSSQELCSASNCTPCFHFRFYLVENISVSVRKYPLGLRYSARVAHQTVIIYKLGEKLAKEGIVKGRERKENRFNFARRRQLAAHLENVSVFPPLIEGDKSDLPSFFLAFSPHPRKWRKKIASAVTWDETRLGTEIDFCARTEGSEKVCRAYWNFSLHLTLILPPPPLSPPAASNGSIAFMIMNA